MRGRPPAEVLVGEGALGTLLQIYGGGGGGGGGRLDLQPAAPTAVPSAACRHSTIASCRPGGWSISVHAGEGWDAVEMCLPPTLLWRQVPGRQPQQRSRGGGGGARGAAGAAATEHAEEAEAAFAVIDTDASGDIDASEWMVLAHTLGLDLDVAQAQAALDSMLGGGATEEEEEGGSSPHSPSSAAAAAASDSRRRRRCITRERFVQWYTSGGGGGGGGRVGSPLEGGGGVGGISAGAMGRGLHLKRVAQRLADALAAFLALHYNFVVLPGSGSKRAGGRVLRADGTLAVPG
eukprot:COSAG01_NODE_302_length_19206_cov_11.098687_4_plen_292_part_00